MSTKKDGAAVDAVLEYLKSQNRPYSVNDIVLNLHKEHGKAAVQKALEKLVQDERVREKTYGKQKVYLVSQVGIPEATPDELKQMDKQIEEEEKRVKELEANLKEVQAELKGLNSSITTEEAQAQVDKLTQRNAELEAKYKILSANTSVVLDKAEREKIRSDRAKLIGEWRRRKKICMEMINNILENWPGTKESLLEEIGIETDEELGVKLPVI